MAKQKEIVLYFYRGMIEARSGWIEGYSENTVDGGIIYPWQGKAKCKQEAASKSKFARFVRECQVGDVVCKKNRKKFKNDEYNQRIVGFVVNESDPERRIAAVFSDNSICNIDRLAVVSRHLASVCKLVAKY